MICTDADLQRLEDRIKELGTEVPWNLTLTTREATAIIARLEAAEGFLNDRNVYEIIHERGFPLWHAWRKSKGETE